MHDCALKWVGDDGSSWNILTGEEGVLAGRGLSGLMFPDVEQRVVETPSGARWFGPRHKPRRVGVTFQVGDNVASLHPLPFEEPHVFFPELGASVARDAYRRGGRWRELDRRFRASLSPARRGRLVCETPDSKRELVLFVDSVTDSMQVWPDQRGFMEYEVDFVGESPFWVGERINYAVARPEVVEQDYYNRVGPDFLLVGSQSHVGQSVHNPGDVEAWPVWQVSGPGQFTFGIGDVTSVTRVLSSGESLVVDTAARSVTDRQGGSAWSRMQSRGFAPIPAGMSHEMVVTSVDTGEGSGVLMSFEPRFMGAY